jgi:hypothetical protein
MAVLPGTILPGSSRQEPPSWPRSPEISERQRVTWPFDARQTSGHLTGGKQDTQPVVEVARSKGGSAFPAFGGDWYHRIHVIPSTIDLGNLVSPVERVLEVWNARFSSATLSGIDATGDDGLLLSGQPAPPLGFGPLQSRLYTFAASTRGAPVIDAAYIFRFADGTAALLVVTGRRVVVFGMRPDWSEGVTERLAWLTEVLEAHDGTEQRVRLRRMPRRSFEYAFLLEGKATRLLDHLLFGWGARVYCLPVWSDVTILASGLSAGTTSITVQDAANADYHAGGLVVLWLSDIRHEAVEILDVSGDVLTLKLPLGSAWPAGTRVYPARLVRLEGEVKVERPTDTLARGRCRFQVEDLSAPPEVDYGPAYQGYRVFDWSPNRALDPEDTWARKLAVIDNRTGLPVFDDESGKPKIGRRLEWLLTDRPQVTAFRGWLAARAGRANPCWLPTFESDIHVTRTVAATDAGLVVENTGYARFINADPIRRDIEIVTTSGTFYRRVTGAFDLSEDEELISLDAALGVTLEPSHFIRVSWLELSRLDQDAVEIHWETDRVARVLLATRTLPS